MNFDHLLSLFGMILNRKSICVYLLVQSLLTNDEHRMKPEGSLVQFIETVLRVTIGQVNNFQIQAKDDHIFQKTPKTKQFVECDRRLTSSTNHAWYDW